MHTGFCMQYDFIVKTIFPYSPKFPLIPLREEFKVFRRLSTFAVNQT